MTDLRAYPHRTCLPARFCCLLLLLTLAACGGDEPESRFTLMTAADTGIDFTNTIVEDEVTNIMSYQYMYNGAGVALGDLDNDGNTDVFLVGNAVPNTLYLNRGDWRFEDVTAGAGVGGRTGDWRTGVNLVDLNGDGWLDIYVCYSGNVAGEGMNAPLQADRPERANQLFINNGVAAAGGLSFTERAAEYGLDAVGTFSSQAYFFDYDRDGDLDMFLVNHANMFYSPFFNTTKLRNKRHPYFGNRLYRNDGGTFTDVSTAAGIHGSGLNYGLSAAVADYDGDGWPDLFVTNDYDEQDYLYLNSRDGTFREVSHAAFGHLSKFSMGTDAADLNDDGRPDLFVADMLPEDNRRQKLLRGPDKYDKYQLAVDSGFHQQNMRNMLQLNAGTDADGVPRFREVGQLAGVAKTDWSWATLFADFDNDRYLDLYVTNGYLRDYTNLDFLRYSQDRVGKVVNTSRESGRDIMALIEQMPVTLLPNYAYRGGPALAFEDQTAAWGLDRPSISNGAAYGDLDGDGDLDLVVNNLNAPAFLYRNNSDTAADHHYLRIALRGTAPNVGGIGAVVSVAVDSSVVTREAHFARGYQSSVEPVLHFGLGGSTRVQRVSVLWPDGTVSTLLDVAADQVLTVTQAGARAGETSPAADTAGLLREVTAGSGLDFVHRENDFVDFRVQRLVPYQLSRLGGKLAVGDVNGDGHDDAYFGGAKGQAGVLYRGDAAGNYRRTEVPAFAADAAYEDLGATFFDADGDGDPDLYVVSGGNELPPGDPGYGDRLYLNDGRGGFDPAGPGALPNAEVTSGSVVVAADYDGDGDQDLFVGGRIAPQYYPLPPRSFLLRNESADGKVRFVDATPEVARAVVRPGMVTDAVWSDVNGDGWKDLVVVGEWMPVTVYLSDRGRSFTDATAALGLSGTQGWWSTITAADVDGDGDPDFLLGNAGTNLAYRASRTEPLEYFVQDLNGDGTPDPVLTYYLQGVSYPAPAYDEMADQLSGSFRKRYGDYASYAAAGSADVIGTPDPARSLRLRINELRSGWLENLGDSLVWRPLPDAVQSSMINGFVRADFDGDGSEEVLCVGNFYPYRVEWGPSDSFFGALLKYRAGGWEVYRPEVSLFLDGDIRAAGMAGFAGGQRQLLLSRNDGAAGVYRWPTTGK